MKQLLTLSLFAPLFASNLIAQTDTYPMDVYVTVTKDLCQIQGVSDPFAGLYVTDLDSYVDTTINGNPAKILSGPEGYVSYNCVDGTDVTIFADIPADGVNQGGAYLGVDIRAKQHLLGDIATWTETNNEANNNISLSFTDNGYSLAVYSRFKIRSETGDYADIDDNFTAQVPFVLSVDGMGL